MTRRYRGGVISASFPVPSASGAVGFYTPVEYTQFKLAQQWPGAADLSISPAVGGKSYWTFAVDGNLALSTPGEYQITFNSSISKVVKMWGGAGMPNSAGSTSWGSGAAGGAATGTVAFTPGIIYYFRVGNRGSTGSPSATAYGAGTGGGIYSVGTAGSGGGYSGIFMNSVGQNTAILMAGGGGGGSSDRADGLGGRGGTAGGGTAGETAGVYQAPPGTQSAGGTAVGNGSPTSGTALQGGNGSGGGAGGGGGYYGGAGGGYQPDGGYGGGGGSGYYNTSYVTSATLYTGTGTTPGNSTDTDRLSTAGSGATAGSNSFPGLIMIKA